MKFRAVAVVSLAILLFLASCGVGLSSAKMTGTFQFRAWIDGSDYVYIQNAGGRVWYEHIHFQYPGLQPPYNASSPAPTYLDGAAWIPVWDTALQKSNIYTNGSSRYPVGEWTALTFTKITNASDTAQSRGPCSIVEYPASNNSYTAKVFLNDNTGSIVYQGAAWYAFEITWEAPDPVAGFPYMIVVALIIVVAAILVILFLLLRRRRKDEQSK